MCDNSGLVNMKDCSSPASTEHATSGPAVKRDRESSAPSAGKKNPVSSEAVHFEVNSASVYPVFLKSRSANSGSVIFESVNCETVSLEATSTGPMDIKDCLGPVPSEPGVILSETVYVKPVDQKDCFSSAHSEQRICRTGTGLSEPAPLSLCAPVLGTAMAQHPPAPVSVSQAGRAEFQLAPAPVSRPAEALLAPAPVSAPQVGSSSFPVAAETCANP